MGITAVHAGVNYIITGIACGFYFLLRTVI